MSNMSSSALLIVVPEILMFDIAPKGNRSSSALTEKYYFRSGDVDGTGGYWGVDDIQIDCGCSAGVNAEEYYACQQYVSTISFDDACVVHHAQPNVSRRCAAAGKS